MLGQEATTLVVMGSIPNYHFFINQYNNSTLVVMVSIAPIAFLFFWWETIYIAFVLIKSGVGANGRANASQLQSKSYEFFFVFI